MHPQILPLDLTRGERTEEPGTPSGLTGKQAVTTWVLLIKAWDRVKTMEKRRKKTPAEHHHKQKIDCIVLPKTTCIL